MRFVFLLLVAVIVIVSGCATQQKPSGAASPSPETAIKTAKYSDPDERFSLNVPDGWAKQNMSFFDASFGQVDEDKRKMVLVGVVIQSTDDNLTNEEALMGVKTALGSNNQFIELDKGVTSIGILHPPTISEPSPYIDFSAKFSGIDVKGRLVVSVVGKKVVSLIYLSDLEDYDKNFEKAEISLNSFTVRPL